MTRYAPSDNVPDATRKKLVEGRRLAKSDLVDWQRILNKKGWAAPTGRRNGAAPAGAPCSSIFSVTRCSRRRRPNRCRSASTWSAR